MSELQKILGDPKFQKAMGVLEPALPILVEMTLEKAVGVIQGLASPDASDAIFELRETATHEQWLKFSRSLVAKGNNKALQEVLDRDNAVKFVAGLFVELYRALRPA